MIGKFVSLLCKTVPGLQEKSQDTAFQVLMIRSAASGSGLSGSPFSGFFLVPAVRQ